MRWTTTTLLCLAGAGSVSSAPLATVASLDLSRYQGSWYEIARLPNWFQKKCASDTMATYRLRADGRIAVTNQCREAGGGIRTARGTARVAGTAKLKVTFFWPFSGDYWVLDLDPEYRWALVGEPSRRYLWILSRQPQMDEALAGDLLARARRLGYNTQAIIRTAQRAPLPPAPVAAR